MTKETSAEPPLSDVEQAHAEYLSYLHGAYKHDRRKKESTMLHKPPNAPESNVEPEEALSDATVSIYDEYKQTISNEWRTPSIIEDRRRLKKQKYNELGQEAGSEFIEEEDDPERSTDDASDDCYKKYTDDLTSAWRMGKKT